MQQHAWVHGFRWIAGLIVSFLGILGVVLVITFRNSTPVQALEPSPQPLETVSTLFLPWTERGSAATPTATSTATSTDIATVTSTATPTATPTASSTADVTATPSPTLTPSATPTATPVTSGPNFSAFWLTNQDVGASTSAVVRVDATGRVHVVFISYSLDQIVYGRCDTSCAEPANWSLVPVGARGGLLGGDPQLQLDPQGRPRLLWHLYQSDSPNGDHDFTVYAECNADCTQSGNWISVAVDNQPPDGAAVGTGMQRNFALDHQGRPAYVNVRTRYDEPSGKYDYTLVYHFCTTGCTNADNWSHVPAITYRDYLLDRFALTYTSTDLPRVAYSTENYENVIQPQFTRRGEIGYIACPANCTEIDSWTQIVPLYYAGYRPMLAIALDNQDRPRIAFYPRQALDPAGNELPYSGKIVFAYCDTDCNSSAPTPGAGWNGYIPGFALTSFDSVDMTLDAQAMPHMVFYAEAAADALVYAVCTANCTVPQAQWTYENVETGSDLPVTPPGPGCSFSAWYVDTNPMSIAVGSNGQAYFGYDTRNLQTCSGQVQEKLRYARFGAWSSAQ